MSIHQGWIGVDLDGTLARYDEWRGDSHIGEPVPAMLERVKKWIAEGKDVRIFTARVGELDLRKCIEATHLISDWCFKHLGEPLVVTCEKDQHLVELWDDRAIQVEQNTGRRIDGKGA